MFDIIANKNNYIFKIFFIKNTFIFFVIIFLKIVILRVIIKNLNPFEEIFTGSNLKSYKHKYFLTNIKLNDSLVDTTFQKSEIGDMKWFSYEECLEKIRDYNIEKIQIVKSIHHLLKNYNIF